MKIGDRVRVVESALSKEYYTDRMLQLKGTIVPVPEKYADKDWATRSDIVWVQWQKEFSVDPKWIAVGDIDVEEVVETKLVVKNKKVKVKTMAKVVKVRRVKGLEIIDNQAGKFFTVIFKSKEDGREVRINGRTGVKKFLKKASMVADTHEDLKTMFNVHKMKYRKVFLDTIKEIRAGGQVYTFE